MIGMKNWKNGLTSDSLLVNPSDVMRFIPVVLGHVLCELVVTEVLDIHHKIKIIVLFRSEDGLNGGNVRHKNRAGRQPGVFVGVVGRIQFQVPI